MNTIGEQEWCSNHGATTIVDSDTWADESGATVGHHDDLDCGCSIQYRR